MLALTSLALAAALSAADARDPRLERLTSAVDAARMKATVAKLVSFGTRHTLSDAESPTRGIGAARRWLLGEFTALAQQPGSRLRPFEDAFTQAPAPRIPRPVEIRNVGAVLPGTDLARAKEALVLTGHYDSRATDVMNATADAPGANDDGSGTALMLELARVMAQERPAISVYFVAVAGEEQGLNGSTHLAQRLQAEGVRVLAMTAVDMIGNSQGQDGVHDDASARLFSEGVPATESEAQRKLRQALGGENDGAAREWCRYVKRVGEREVEHLDLWLMLRRDRIARGSDHLAFSQAGFPAIRLVEAHEHWDRQHQDVRAVEGRRYGDLLEHVDFAYAAKLGRALLAAVTELAAAPAPPREVALGGAVGPDTRLHIALPADGRVTGLILYRRRADGIAWQRAVRYPPQPEIDLKDVVPDNFTFAVATVDADGRESLPVYPGRLE